MPSHFPERLTGGIRRVTTGVDHAGKAVVVANEHVTGDERALLLWGGDTPPRIGDAAQPPASGWWPPPGGVRVSISSRAPDCDTGAAKPAQSWPDINDAAGFHASRSSDIVIVISGRIWCELDDGVEIELTAGDVLIQNGTRHRWHNHGDSWPIIAVVIVGAELP